MPSDQSLSDEPPPDPSDSLPETPSLPSSEPSIEPESFQTPPAEILPWWQVWLKVLTSPTIASLQVIINDPSASLKRGLIWFYAIVFLIDIYLLRDALWRVLPQYPWMPIYLVFLILIVGSLLAAVLTTLMFAIIVGVVNIYAKALGGQGSYDKLLYAISAIYSPILLISGVIRFLPYFKLLGYLIGLYAFLLAIVSIRVVHRIGWFKAIAAFLAPPVMYFSCSFLAYFILSHLFSLSSNIP